jgi:tartrate dehydrogenase/decarboxylase/D-malate dehydrogenase
MGCILTLRGKSIAVIPGDGVGVEVTDAALSVLRAVVDQQRSSVAFTEFPWGCSFFERHGRMMPADALETLAGFDAILLGACGWPTVPDHVSLWGLRLAICQGFDQGVCVRPVQLLPGVESPLRRGDASTVNFVVVRENAEGEYAGVGGRAHRGLQSEVAIESSVYSRRNITRVVRYALELARSGPSRHVVSVTKSNASQHAGVLWDEVATAVAEEFPDVTMESELVDAMAARLVLRPDSVHVMVASNLHADILSDLTAALAGGLGVAPSANLNIEGNYPSMFEPVHGSAPDIAGTDTANPIGAILSAAMLLDHVGFAEGASSVRLGGNATTRELAESVIATLT